MKCDFARYVRYVMENLGDELIMKAHQAAVAVTREVAPRVKVGFTLSLHDIQAVPDSLSADQTGGKNFIRDRPVVSGTGCPMNIQCRRKTALRIPGMLPCGQSD